MASRSPETYRQHFSQNWIAWIAIRHFLPAHLLRELICATIEDVSNGEHSLDDLFSEILTDGPESIITWVLQQRPCSSPVGEFLQRLIRIVAWQSDSQIGYLDDSTDSASASKMAASIKALEFGSLDFGFPEDAFSDALNPLQPSAAALAIVLVRAKHALLDRTVPEFVSLIEEIIKAVDWPLNAAIMKHVGDLCADADAWENALALYRGTKSLLGRSDVSPWDNFVMTLSEIATQSEAAALRTLRGGTQAEAFLGQFITDGDLHEMPLLLINGSFDMLVAGYASSDRISIGVDRRPTVLAPPLMYTSHSPDAGMLSWAMGQFAEANRRYWATLRRQISLGLAAETRDTKALYSRSLLDELQATETRNHNAHSFQMAVRLLIESGNADSVSKMRWGENLVNGYVDGEQVALAITHGNRHEGSRLERQRVLVEMFQHWVEVLSPEQDATAHEMLKYVAARALESPASGSTSHNLGGRSLEILNYLGTRRPELRGLVIDEVALAVSAKLRNPGFWTAITAALTLTKTYDDAFTQTHWAAITGDILDLLNVIGTNGMAHVIQPAVAMLVADPVKDLARQDLALGKRVVATIIEFGVKQQGLEESVLFNLYNFDPVLLEDRAIQETLRDTISAVRLHAKEINSSNVINNIQALLLAPTISKLEGIQDALDSLSDVLKLARDPRRGGLALPIAYQPLLLLANHKEKIANALVIGVMQFEQMLRPIMDLVVEFWGIAAERPLVLANFSIPPQTIPNSVIVHNWTYASLAFADALGQTDRIESALTNAQRQADLRNAIALATTTQSLARNEHQSIDPQTVQNENREVFYAALGARLVALEKAEFEDGREICKVLVVQCLRQGPREIDAAVFLAAIRFRLQEYVRDIGLSNYRRRLDGNRDRRLSLMPILAMFEIDRSAA